MDPEEIKTKKQHFLCYYDRKEDLVSPEDANALIAGGHVTMREIFDAMKQTLKEHYPTIKHK
jgi:hypothetical protein